MSFYQQIKKTLLTIGIELNNLFFDQSEDRVSLVQKDPQLQIEDLPPLVQKT
jgi:hypothetical protein